MQKLFHVGVLSVGELVHITVTAHFIQTRITTVIPIDPSMTQDHRFRYQPKARIRLHISD